MNDQPVESLQGTWGAAAMFWTVGAIIGGVLTWLLDFWRIRELKGQIAKLELESVNEAGKALANIQDHRLVYTASCVACRVCADELLKVMANSAAPEDAKRYAREEFCRSISEDVIPKFRNLTEWVHLSKKTEPDSLARFVETEVIPEMRRFGNWISVSNSRYFVVKLNLAPLALSTGTTHPFLELLDDVSAPDKQRLRPLMATEIGRMRGG